MDPEPEVIRQQIDDTRSALTEKLETLEAEVKDTVQSVRDSVGETVQSVKDSVGETVDSVKRTFDLPYQTEQRPWLMLGLSLVSGAVAGALLAGRRTDRVAAGMARAAEPVAPYPRLLNAEPPRPTFVDKLTQQLGGEWEKVKDLAVATLAGVVRDMAEQAAPALRQNVEQLLSNAATRFTAPEPEAATVKPHNGYDYGARPPFRRGDVA